MDEGFSEQKTLTDLALLGDKFKEPDMKKIFLVADRRAYDKSGASEIIGPMISGNPVEIFDSIEPNPKLETVLDCSRKIQLHCPDLILAVGGGSAMDVAKLANWIGAGNEINTGPDTSVRPTVPLVAVPTTSGSGAEATHFSVFYVDGVKGSAAHPSMRPTVTVLEPKLTAKLPPQITAHSGLDALCQSIESIWSVHANEESMKFATRALELVWHHLPGAVNSPSPEARAAMLTGSNLAGKAINITKTTLPHALSYTITTKHRVPHGLAVALTLGPVMIFNDAVQVHDCTDPRGPESVRSRISSIYSVTGSSGAEDFADKFKDLLLSIGCPSTSQEAGITSLTERELICAQVNPERLKNNPRKVSREQLLQLL